MLRKQGPRRRIHSLAVHPAQPHLAATGASDGSLAMWDLRFERGSRPQQAALDQPGAGAVLQVHLVPCNFFRQSRVRAFDGSDILRVVPRSGNNPVVQVEFDTSDASSAAEPYMLFCTQGGILGVAAPGFSAPQQRQKGLGFPGGTVSLADGLAFSKHCWQKVILEVASVSMSVWRVSRRK